MAAAQPHEPAPGGRVELGAIVGVHGLEGWLKLMSFTEPREAIFEYRPLIVGGEAFEEFEGRPRGKGLVIRFPDHPDRTSAEPLVGAKVEVDRSQLPELGEGEYYWSDLVGAAVETRDGTALGTVRRMLSTGAHDVLVIQGERERLIPWVLGTYVASVDLERRRLVVDWDPDWD